MPVKLYPENGAVWFNLLETKGGPDFPTLTIWDDGEVILDASPDNSEFIYPTLEEWEFLAKVVDTNIERLRKENLGDQHRYPL